LTRGGWCIIKSLDKMALNPEWWGHFAPFRGKT
jgi:hypothetical protein